MGLNKLNHIYSTEPLTVDSLVSNNDVVALDDLVVDGSILIDGLNGSPNQYLKIDPSGNSLEWVNLDALPTQTNNSGKWLQTNGTAASWQSIDLSIYAPKNNSLLTGITSATTLNLTNALSYEYGGTGITYLGTLGQILAVNDLETGVEWIDPPVGGGGGGGIAISSNPPANPDEGDAWQDLDSGRFYTYDGTYWVEVQSQGTLGLLRYLGASDTEPTTSLDGSALDVGEVYFNTTFNSMRVWNGTEFQDSFTPATVTANRWVKTIGVGTFNSLSGDDDNSISLIYTPGAEEVYLNGVKLLRGLDYIATDGLNITNMETLITGSIVEVVSLQGYVPALTYTALEVDGLIQKGQLRWTRVVGAGVTTAEFSGTDDYGNFLEYIVGTESVYVNGILQARPLDYAATTGTTVVLTVAAVAGDIVEVIGNKAFSVANTYTKGEVDAKLGNLNSPTISGNTLSAGNLSPSVTNTYDLGTTSLRWRNIYTQDLHLSNGIGDYTVVEGEEDLFLVNNKSGKSFKFALIEVDPSQVPPKSESN